MSQDFLEMYLEYTKHQVSPTQYHRWVALAILGAAMERRCWLTRGYKVLRISPGQIMVVLVGKSAMEKKTTAVNFGGELLSHLPVELFKKLPKKTSPSRLGVILAREDEEGNPMRFPADHPNAGRRVNSSGFLVAGELASFFSTDAWNETMAATVNEINDAPAGVWELDFMSYQRKLWNPIIGLVGGITPRGIAAELPKAARQAGFFGRIIWVHSHGTDRFNPMTELIPEQKELEEKLRQGLSAIAYMAGPFQYTRQGKAEFERWYKEDYVPRIRRMESIGVIDSSGYWGRKDGHVLRVAMACSASRSWGSDRLLKRGDIVRAVSYLDEVEKGFDAAMAEIGVGLAFTEENARILAFIENRGELYNGKGGGWVAHRDIARYAHSRLGMRKYGLDDCLQRLTDAGELEKSYRAGERTYVYKRKWTSGGLIKKAVEEQQEG